MSIKFFNDWTGYEYLLIKSICTFKLFVLNLCLWPFSQLQIFVRDLIGSDHLKRALINNLNNHKYIGNNKI